MTTLSTHVLDMASGAPATHMSVHLSRAGSDGWERLEELETDQNGRIAGFGELGPGRYRLGFETGEWGNTFYPFIHVTFLVDDATAHYHLPLLLGPFGYTTYRGS